jgi:V-type H+-transporting ATPase subunit a
LEESLGKKAKENGMVLEQTKAQMRERLDQFTGSLPDTDGSALFTYKWFFEREKTLYTTLNMFKSENSWFKGLFWCPLSKKPEVDATIERLQKFKNALCSNLKEITDHDLAPPTYFRCNDFIRPFQEIVYTYGIPTYQEANPTLFTIITFPFLFGIMFGDLAHGLVLLSLSIYVCWRKDYLIRTKALLADVVEFRYLLMLMAFFAAYCGFLYNDFAAVPLNFIRSCYEKDMEKHVATKPDPTCVYPAGVDPMWYASENELQYINSFKMKISVIVGVSHMIIGIVLKGMNAVQQKSSIDFWCEFVPQIIFMVAFFGYMNYMIIIKWLTDWSSVGQDGPAIITLLISIPLKGSDPGKVPLYGDGTLQQTIGQTVLSKKSFPYQDSHIHYLRSLDAHP